jgi:hypothetical protein
MQKVKGRVPSSALKIPANRRVSTRLSDRVDGLRTVQKVQGSRHATAFRSFPGNDRFSIVHARLISRAWRARFSLRTDSVQKPTRPERACPRPPPSGPQVSFSEHPIPRSSASSDLSEVDVRSDNHDRLDSKLLANLRARGPGGTTGRCWRGWHASSSASTHSPRSNAAMPSAARTATELAVRAVRDLRSQRHRCLVLKTSGYFDRLAGEVRCPAGRRGPSA